jgi:hypothetical protein
MPQLDILRENKSRPFLHSMNASVFLLGSVADPWHFGADPDPWIRTSGLRIRIRLRLRLRILVFSSVTFKTTHKFICLLLFEATFTSFFKDKKS